MEDNLLFFLWGLGIGDFPWGPQSTLTSLNLKEDPQNCPQKKGRHQGFHASRAIQGGEFASTPRVHSFSLKRPM